jgi:hypothetical protein
MKPAPTAGYSGKTLAQKLGLKPGAKVLALSAPAHYRDLIGALPEGARFVGEDETADLVHAFIPDRAALAAQAAGLPGKLAPGGSLWISWPKKSSPLFVDLTEGGVREFVLSAGWVDVKVCAVDETWSGLKFLRRRG